MGLQSRRRPQRRVQKVPQKQGDDRLRRREETDSIRRRQTHRRGIGREEQTLGAGRDPILEQERKAEREKDRRLHAHEKQLPL